MIIKINNQADKFYYYLGKVFGSRQIENITHDRIYDDDNKEWYLYINNGNPEVFVSVVGSKIKNIWSYNREHLIEILKKISVDLNIGDSIVTNLFKNEYIEAGYTIVGHRGQNFLIIRSEFLNE